MAHSLSFSNASIHAHCWTFEWILDNFTFKPGSIYSNEIYFTDKCPQKWKIFAELTTDNSRNNNYSSLKTLICVGLQRLDTKNSNVKATLFFKLKNSIGEVYLTESTELSSSKSACKSNPVNAPKTEGYVMGFNKKVFRLIAGKLIIVGKVIVEDCCLPKTQVEVSSNDNTKQLQLDFKQLWQNSEFIDVKMQVENEVVGAHKFVLCARSSVFKKMFQHDMKEKACSSVVIVDMKKHVLETFLTFLYTGNVEDKKFETVITLYSAADKYEVQTLQETCRGILVSFLSHETASTIIKLADTHNDDSLRNSAVGYICQNFPEVESTADWNNLLDSDPRLTSFVLKKVSLTYRKT